VTLATASLYDIAPFAKDVLEKLCSKKMRAISRRYRPKAERVSRQ
jgi:hypothetical protein